MEHIVKTLESGTRLVYVTDHNSPSVEVTLLFKYGSRTDPKNRQGLTHLLEHLNFQGTNSRKTNRDIVLQIENFGGQVDAFTGYEHLGFSIKCPSQNINKCIDILFDIVCNSMYGEAEVEKEKNVILEEIKMYDDIPSEKARDTFQTLMFGSNNLGENIAGNLKTLSSVTRDDILSHKAALIAQDGLLVSVSGDFKINDAENQIIELIKRMPVKSTVAQEKFDLLAYKSRTNIINIKRDIAQSNVILGTYGHKRTLKKNYALSLGNIILSGGMGSLLYQKIREEHRLAYYVNSAHTEYGDIGVFEVEMGVDDDKLNRAVDEVGKVLKRFMKGDFSDGDFNRAKNYLLGAVTTQLETSSDLASWNAYNLIHRGSEVFETKDQIINSINKVTPDSVKSAWGEILSANQLFYVNVGKKELII